MNEDPNWFRRWFDMNYLRVYHHRDDTSAIKEAEQILALPEVPHEGLFLDIACGAGRHVRAFEKKQIPIVGGDLSLSLLSEGRRTSPSARYVAHDMRCLPYRNSTFTGVFSLFTSFGYFLEEHHHRHVLQEVRRVLIPGSVFLLDYLNPAQVMTQPTPSTERCLNDCTIIEKREYNPSTKRLRKDIVLRDSNGTQEYVESVRVFDNAELICMLNEAGFSILAVYGELNGSAFSSASPRQIVLSRSNP